MENFARTSHYISELLFRHDCVIVPGFGGFVCSYAPAKVHPAQHIFTPPSKQVFFNKHLQQNDGLLVNAIATSVPCSFEEALKDVNDFVANIQSQLKNGRKVELPYLGAMSIDPEGNLSFENNQDVNFLMDSFGLSSFQSLPILRETVTEKHKTVEPIIRTLHEEAVVTATTQRPYRVLKVAAAIVLPILAIGILFTVSNNMGGNGLAGFGLFKNNEPSKYQPVKWFVKENNSSKDENKVQPDAAGNYALSIDENSAAMVVNIHKVAPDTTRVNVQISLDHPTIQDIDSGKYYVIGGCFGVAENAENYRKALVRKGYKPVVLDHVRSKLTHISLAKFDTKEEAAAFLSTIRTDIPEAWVLKQK